MPRYFFDIHDGELHPDNEGTECADLDQVHQEAMNALPEIARDAIPSDGDRQAYTVHVRDEANNLIYMATLTFSGFWMNRPVAG